MQRIAIRCAVFAIVSAALATVQSCTADAGGTTDPEEAPSITLSVSSITFASVQGAAGPPPQAVQVTAGGRELRGLTAVVGYGAGPVDGWLSAVLSSTSAPSTLTLTAQTAGLAPGTYNATVRVVSAEAANGSQAVAVALTVSPGQPQLALSGTSVTFTGAQGSATAGAKTLEITNAGGGTLTGLSVNVQYGPGQASGWLTATLSSTTAPSTLTLIASTAARPAGTYDATVTVSAPGAAGSPAAIGVTLTVTAPPPAMFPLAAGKRWRYELADTTTIGPDRFITVGTLVLQVIEEGTLDGRRAWHLEAYELANLPRNGPALDVFPVYLATDALGLLRYTGGAWRRVLSTTSSIIPGGTLVLAGAPAHDPRVELAPSSISVPAGTFSTTRAYHHHREGFEQYSEEDIDEERTEHFVSGLGIVYANIDYFYEYNIGTAGHRLYRRTLRLTHADAGPFPEVVNEAAANTSPSAAQALSGPVIARADAMLGDAGTVLTDAAVGCSSRCIHPNRAGQQIIEDWYRITLPGTRNLRIDLHFSTAGAPGQRIDLDLYLFGQSGSGIRFLASSVEEPGTREFLQGTASGGVYYIGIQAYDTPTGRADYWLNVRTY